MPDRSTSAAARCCVTAAGPVGRAGLVADRSSAGGPQAGAGRRQMGPASVDRDGGELGNRQGAHGMRRRVAGGGSWMRSARNWGARARLLARLSFAAALSDPTPPCQQLPLTTSASLYAYNTAQYHCTSESAVSWRPRRCVSFLDVMCYLRGEEDGDYCCATFRVRARTTHVLGRLLKRPKNAGSPRLVPVGRQSLVNFNYLHLGFINTTTAAFLPIPKTCPRVQLSNSNSSLKPHRPYSKPHGSMCCRRHRLFTEPRHFPQRHWLDSSPPSSPSTPSTKLYPAHLSCQLRISALGTSGPAKFPALEATVAVCYKRVLS